MDTQDDISPVSVPPRDDAPGAASILLFSSIIATAIPTACAFMLRGIYPDADQTCTPGFAFAMFGAIQMFFIERRLLSLDTEHVLHRADHALLTFTALAQRFVCAAALFVGPTMLTVVLAPALVSRALGNGAASAVTLVLTIGWFFLTAWLTGRPLTLRMKFVHVIVQPKGTATALNVCAALIAYILPIMTCMRLTLSWHR